MTLSEKAHLRRLKALERTSSADLEALLLLDFQSQETGEAEMDEVLRAAEILAKRQPRQDSSGADRAWAEFLEKYRPFADGSSLYESAEALGASAVAVQPRPRNTAERPQFPPPHTAPDYSDCRVSRAVSPHQRRSAAGFQP